MKNYPLVSIVIPAFNEGKYIGKAIESLILQTYKNIEIVVVNDASKDNTEQVVLSYKNDANIKYELFLKNSGVTVAWNRGHDLASGDFVLYLDADNFLHPKAIEQSIDFLINNPQYDVAYFDLFHFFDNDIKRQIYYHKMSNPSGLIFGQLIRGEVSLNLSRAIFKREIIKDVFFDESLRYGGDWDYWLKVASKNAQFGFLDKKLLYSRQRTSGNSCGGIGRYGSQKDFIYILEKWKDEISDDDKDDIENRIKRAKMKKIINLAEFGGKKDILAELNQIKSDDYKEKILKIIIGLFVLLPKSIIRLLSSMFYFYKTRMIFKKTNLTIEETIGSEKDDKEFQGGERLYLDKTKFVDRKMLTEHFDRYKLALNYINPDFVVLDAACGSGYGSEILAGRAKKVVGADASSHAIKYANNCHKKDNIEFIESDLNKSLDFPNDYFDMIVSLETLEHVLDQEKMISEFRRILKKGGLLLISSPDREIITGKAGNDNKYHIKELSKKEFVSLLRNFFDVDDFFVQTEYIPMPTYKKFIKNSLRGMRGIKKMLVISFKLTSFAHHYFNETSYSDIRKSDIDAPNNNFYILIALCRKK